MSRLGAFAFAVAFAVTAAATAAADDAVKPDQSKPPVNPAIQVARGDSWTYENRDDVTGDLKGAITFEVTKVTGAEIETRVTQLKQATDAQTTTTAVFDSHWRMKDNGKVVYQPYLDSTGVPGDLQVGKSWSFKCEALRKGSALTQEFAGVGKVEAWERVTLPNGSAYDTFKIDVTSASTLATNHRTQETHSIMWFAPSVNRLVKRTDEIRVDGKLRDATEQTLREYKPATKI